MDEKLSQSNPFPPVFLRAGVILVLLASATAVFSSARWIYQRVQYSLGLEVADVAVAFLIIVILVLVLLGFGAGFGAKRILRTRKVHACKIYHALEWCTLFRAFWGYLGPPVEKSEKAVTPPKQAVPELPVLPSRPAKRGRTPEHSIHRWAEVVDAWDKRDTWRNPMTLNEFLSQQFGTCPDGSPRMSRKSFYDWKKRVREEARKQQATKKDSSS